LAMTATKPQQKTRKVIISIPRLFSIQRLFSKKEWKRIAYGSRRH
jgi:hypothetical protein